MSRPETDLLDSLSPELSQLLKDRVDRALLEFIRPNSASQFAQDAPELAKFRDAIAQGDSKDDLEFLGSFREFVPTTNYESYRPFIAKFFATPCKEVDVKNMFAPGLPYFLAMSVAPSAISSVSSVRGEYFVTGFPEVFANLNDRLRRRSVQADDSLLSERRLSANGNELGRRQ